MRTKATENKIKNSDAPKGKFLTTVKNVWGRVTNQPFIK